MVRDLPKDLLEHKAEAEEANRGTEIAFQVVYADAGLRICVGNPGCVVIDKPYFFGNYQYDSFVKFGDAITDFFDKQKIVDFKKIWHYQDSVSNFKKIPDINYLTLFEKKYNINLWNVAYTDKSFYLYNEFYKFTTNEILSIIEQECKFFEKILETSQPQYFLTYHTDNHYQYLL